MAKDTSGPAFPTDEYFDERRLGQTPGMTLRDYFAGQALIALAMMQLMAGRNETATLAYELADAMLKERKK